MILKKLTSTGFKSFADKTEFEFDAGITCIVGPNGCGKSNVVDSIKWVLGAQSAKSLRGKHMLDVIFNGSGTRKSSGMAQVDLTFDNTDGLLPIDQTEVTVSRRLYRSGESEYLINRSPVRLKDIRELFLDTGIGVDAYSVIEQNRVSAMLDANALERRSILEEAAGINKYKMRKKEALRRLERVNQSLLRVQDVVEEVERRLRSVKLQAGKARNYEAYSQQLRELRSRYALAEYHRLSGARDSLDAEITERSDEATRLRTAISDNEVRTSEANVRIVDLEKETQATESKIAACQSQISGTAERIAAFERRIIDQEAVLERSRERLSGFDGQMSSLESRLAEQEQAAKRVEAELAEVQQDQTRVQEEDTACALSLNEKRAALEELKESIIELVRRQSQLQNELLGYDVQSQSLADQKAKLEAREAEVAQELAGAEVRRDELQKRISELVERIAERNASLEQTKTRLADVGQQRASLIDQIGAAKEYRSGLESRRELLEEMDSKHEGLLAGAREILEQRDADETGERFGYILGAVGELFETDVAHAGIVEAVLGSMETDLVATERAKLIADRDALGELSGRVQTFCLDAVPVFVAGPDLSAQEGFVARLLDWVKYPEQCDVLARHLMGRTYVVQTVDAATSMARLDTHARFVTMSGIVIEPDGRLSVGALGSDTGMISRRSELRELARELEEAKSRIARLSEDLARSESEASSLENSMQELRSNVYELNTERVQEQSALSNVENRIRVLNGERPVIASDIAALAKRLSEIAAKAENARETLKIVEHKNIESEQHVGEFQSAVDELVAKRSEIAERLTAMRVRVGELSQQRGAVAQSIRELQASRIQLEAERDRAQRDFAEAQDRIDQSRKQIDEANESLTALKQESGELQRVGMTLRQERDDLRDAVDQFVKDARRLRSELDRVDGELHERQIKLQEVRVRLEDLVNRVRDELSVDLSEQYASYVPDEEEDWPAVEAQINELRKKIDRLGSVNLDAIREQQELEDREKFLTEQLADLRDSEKQLATLIEKLNKESEQRFKDTFASVSKHFTSLFKKLFGGGKAELVLQDPDDVLECGVDILARPPGKEPRNITQLSGGEKTMTAIALLLAVFRSRPSPFVLLDEVDAALDEANNMRFNNVVKEFVELSQFIIITHSKPTMGIADVMYGVTMQEAGVSKRVSVRFDDVSDSQSAVA
ncbi:MAG: chromosome segregation protein SMC [Phycisphaerales bacterium]|nr:chromosome segregation protein SMC [Phycisphaerales bacterium]MCB9857727.1 chromosome segregation protein SMC [Phycisphaerales bacterium]MCB9863787.1 chromosome segregation protein SMC [Phycisphaerales bacterium]